VRMLLRIYCLDPTGTLAHIDSAIFSGQQKRAGAALPQSDAPAPQASGTFYRVCQNVRGGNCQKVTITG
jgi:hypothetical protein